MTLYATDMITREQILRRAAEQAANKRLDRMDKKLDKLELQNITVNIPSVMTTVVNGWLTPRLLFYQNARMLESLAPIAKLVPTLLAKIRMGEAVVKATNVRAAGMGQSDREKMLEEPGPPFHFLPDLQAFVNDNARWAQAYDAVMEALTVSRLVTFLSVTVEQVYYLPFIFPGDCQPRQVSRRLRALLGHAGSKLLPGLPSVYVRYIAVDDLLTVILIHVSSPK